MPIEPSAKFGSTLQIGKKHLNPAYSRSYYLLINDGNKYNAYVLTIIADSSYVKNDVSKLANNTYRRHDPDFSGKVLYFTPTGTYLGGYAYQNGQLVNTASTEEASNIQKVQSISTEKLKPNNMVPECTDWYIAYFTDGVFQYAEYLGTTCVNVDNGSGSGGGGGGSSSPSLPPPPPCPAGSHTGPPVVHPCIPYAVDAINDGRLKTDFIPPPGDGGLPPPTQTPCTVDLPAKPCPADPCTQAKALISDAKFKSEMNDLKSKTALPNEVGYTIDANGNYVYVQGPAGQASIGLAPTTPLSGYIHTHYTGTFPTFSGSDVRAIYQLQQLGKVADISKFTAGVVTASGTTYMIKINDPIKFAAFAATNLSTAANFQLFENYYANKEKAYELVGKDKVSAYELALLSSLANSGVTILKGNLTFTAWNTDTINATNGITDSIVTTTCN
jgi:hypothetical protein